MMQAARPIEMQFETEPIELRGGWSGFVLTRADGATSPWIPSALPMPTDWQQFLGRLVADAGGIPEYAALKVSRSVEVIRGRISFGKDSLEVICKHMRAAARRRAARAWRASRERRNFDRAFDLLHCGLDTALPLAIVERRRPRRATWLVTAYVPNLVDLDHVVLAHLTRIEPRYRRRVKDALIAAVVRLCVQIERHGFHYRDLKASNILLANWDSAAGPIRTVLVDLDGMHARRFWQGRQNWRSLVRLAASLSDHGGATRGDFCRFFKAYLSQTGGDPDRWKPRFRALQRRVRDYVDRAKRRKLHKFDGYNGG